ncbi:MAG: oligosaccharide flippase family protein [Candidatus Omnitrophota bacterium]
MYKTLFKPALFITLANYIGGALLFIANMLLANQFGPEDFGTFKVVIALFSFLPSLVDLGAGATLVRYISHYRDQRVYPLILKFVRLMFWVYSGLTLGMFFIRGPIAGFFLKDFNQAGLIAAGILLFALSYLELFKQIAIGFQKFKIYAFSQMLTFAVMGLASYFLGRQFGIFWAIIGWASGYLLGNIVCLLFFFKKNIRESGEDALEFKSVFLSYSIPMYLMVIPGLIGLVAIPVLSVFFNQKLIGYLSFAMIFYQAAISIPTAFSTVLFPKFSGLSNQGQELKQLVKKSILLYTPIAIFGSICCLLLSFGIISSFFPAYRDSILIFNFLVIYAFISGYLLIGRAYFSGTSRLKQLAILTFCQNIGLLITAAAAVYLVFRGS